MCFGVHKNLCINKLRMNGTTACLLKASAVWETTQFFLCFPDLHYSSVNLALNAHCYSYVPTKQDIGLHTYAVGANHVNYNLLFFYAVE